MITKTIPEVFMGEDDTQTLGVECAVELQSVRENFFGLVAMYWYVARALMNCLMTSVF